MVPEDKESGGKAPDGAPDRARPRRFQIDIYRAWCKACGICVEFCPQRCLLRDEEGAPVIEAQERCTGCGWCEIHCPDFAISVREETEHERNGGKDRDDD